MIIVGIPVYNDSGRYLKKTISGIVKFADRVIIMDDNSRDDTVLACKDWFRKYRFTNYKIARNYYNVFSTGEDALRSKLWLECKMEACPNDWIFMIDSDEIVDNAEYIKSTLKDAEGSNFEHNCNTFCATVYDMWSNRQYRDDSLWYPHSSAIGVKVDKDFVSAGEMLGRFPIKDNSNCISDIRVSIRHMRFARKDERFSKCEKLLAVDNCAKNASIIDNSRNLNLSIYNAKHNTKTKFMEDEYEHNRRIAEKA